MTDQTPEQAPEQTPEQTPRIKLETYWPYHAVVLADRITRLTTEVVKSTSSLNLSQWRVLVAVGETPGRSAAQVVALTPMDKGIVSRAVSSLIETGHLRREIAPDDRRRSALFLTPKGDQTYRDISAVLLEKLGGFTNADRAQKTLQSAAAFVQACSDPARKETSTNPKLT